MTANYGRGLYKEYELLLSENEAIKAQYELLCKEHQILQKEIKLKEKIEAELIGKAAEIETLKEDGILKLLPSDTVVMHDHNKINYNKEYSFSNIEYNVHLLRDLHKTTDNLQHEWSAKLKSLLEKTNIERNDAIERGEETFEDDYVKAFYREFDLIMLNAMEENKADYNKYYAKDERTLILRILDYKDNYLSWVVNFELPFSNNLSERALRGVKSKMKISGQFQTEESAKHYAAIKSYIETCYRNGINETEALIRLCEGNPYTVKEIFEGNSGE
jgi:hypothetical protein